MRLSGCSSWEGLEEGKEMEKCCTYFIVSKIKEKIMSGTGDVAQWLESLPSMAETLNLIPSIMNLKK